MDFFKEFQALLRSASTLFGHLKYFKFHIFYDDSSLNEGEARKFFFDFFENLVTFFDAFLSNENLVTFFRTLKPTLPLRPS